MNEFVTIGEKNGPVGNAKQAPELGRGELAVGLLHHFFFWWIHAQHDNVLVPA